MKRFIGKDTESLSYFSTYSPSELRHLSYRETNFCILCRESVPPRIGTNVTLISACYSENADTDRTGISWGVRKEGNHCE